MTVALGDGTPYAKMIEALVFCEAKRAEVGEHEQRVRERVTRDLIQRRRVARLSPPTEIDITVATNNHAGADDRYKIALAGEQWGHRLVVQYALLELVAQQQATNHLLGELIREIRTGALADVG